MFTSSNYLGEGVLNYCDSFEDGRKGVDHDKNNSNHSATDSLDI